MLSVHSANWAPCPVNNNTIIIIMNFLSRMQLQWEGCLFPEYVAQVASFVCLFCSFSPFKEISNSSVRILTLREKCALCPLPGVLHFWLFVPLISQPRGCQHSRGKLPAPITWLEQRRKKLLMSDSWGCLEVLGGEHRTLFMEMNPGENQKEQHAIRGAGILPHSAVRWTPSP